MKSDDDDDDDDVLSWLFWGCAGGVFWTLVGMVDGSMSPIYKSFNMALAPLLWPTSSKSSVASFPANKWHFGPSEDISKYVTQVSDAKMDA